MVLKEACRYQNVLQNVINQLDDYLSSMSNITTKTQKHLRSKAIKDVEDEEVIVKQRSNDCSISNNDLLAFYDALVNEKISLTMAISDAKRKCEDDIDALVESNRVRQRYASRMKRMSGVVSKERDTEGTAYTFNNEGNQIPYRYKIEEVVSIDFDRNVVKSVSKKMSAMADEISTKIDLLNATIKVDFEPMLSMTVSSFEDAYEEYQESVNH